MLLPLVCACMCVLRGRCGHAATPSVCVFVCVEGSVRPCVVGGHVASATGAPRCPGSLCVFMVLWGHVASATGTLLVLRPLCVFMVLRGHVASATGALLVLRPLCVWLQLMQTVCQGCPLVQPSGVAR
jgi:hypothetical protein